MTQKISYQIREWILEDIKEIARLEEEIFSTPWSEKSLMESFENPDATFLVAMLQDKVIGYIGFYCVVDEGYVYNIAVQECHRRKGIADKLLKSAEEKCIKKEVVFISLEVRKSNNKAVELYQKNGFESVGVRKDFYAKPKEDALIMTKKIKGVQFC